MAEFSDFSDFSNFSRFTGFEEFQELFGDSGLEKFEELFGLSDFSDALDGLDRAGFEKFDSLSEWPDAVATRVSGAWDRSWESISSWADSLLDDLHLSGTTDFRENPTAIPARETHDLERSDTHLYSDAQPGEISPEDVCGLDQLKPAPPGSAGMTISIGGVSFGLGAGDGDSNGDSVSDSVTLTDDRGMTVFTDSDGDGIVDECTTVHFDGGYSRWALTGTVVDHAMSGLGGEEAGAGSSERKETVGTEGGEGKGSKSSEAGEGSADRETTQTALNKGETSQLSSHSVRNGEENHHNPTLRCEAWHHQSWAQVEKGKWG